MCIIAVQGIGKTIKKEYFDHCAKSNPDGFGLCYVSGGKVVSFKTMRADVFWQKYLSVTETYGYKSPVVLHFRWGTAGIKDERNCHPFYVNNNVAFVHNGVISGVGYDDEISDTQLFNNKVLKGLGKNFLKEKGTLEMIKNWIGTDKLAFLSVKGKEPVVTYVNKELGTEDNGIWYSHSRFKPYNYNTAVTVGTSKYYCKECGKRIYYLGERTNHECNACAAKRISNTFSPQKVCSHCKGTFKSSLVTEIGTGEGKRFLCAECIETLLSKAGLSTPKKERAVYIGENRSIIKRGVVYEVTDRHDNGSFTIDVAGTAISVTSKWSKDFVTIVE